LIKDSTITLDVNMIRVNNGNGELNVEFWFDYDETLHLSNSLEEFTSLANDTFWHFPSMTRFEPVNDGAIWLLEGYVPEKGYHLVSRWSPNKKRDYQFRQLCEYLINFTGLFKKRFIY